jgi:hypothetical protein
VFQLAIERVGGISSSVVVSLSPLILAEIDFIIMLTGRQAKWAMRLYKAFYVLNVLTTSLSYAIILSRRNSCIEESISGGMAVVTVVFNIAQAGQQLALIKLHLKKIRYPVSSPVLNYGTSSHVLVSPPRPGEKATLVMTDGDVMLTPAMPEDDAVTAPGQRTVHLTFPPSRFLRLVNLWGMAGVLWIASQITQSGLDAATLRAKPLQRCWETRPAFKARAILSASNTTLAAALLVTMFALVIIHGLARVLGKWIAYWYRRNWVLVSASFLRGLAFIRPEYPTSVGISSFINNSVFLALRSLLLMSSFSSPSPGSSRSCTGCSSCPMFLERSSPMSPAALSTIRATGRGFRGH